MSAPVTPNTVQPDELKRIQDLQNQFSALTHRYGELHFQKRFIDEEMLAIDEEMTKLEAGRMEMMAALQNKYGTGTIDVTSGMFVPSIEPTTAPVS